MNVLSNLAIILLGFIANIDKYKTDSTSDQISNYIYSIKWNKTVQDQTLQVGGTDTRVDVVLLNGYAIIAHWGNGNEGTAEIYERASDGTWNFTQKLIDVRAESRAWFGVTVGMSHGYAIVGARFEDAAYIYKRASNGTWNLAQKLEGNQTGSGFGWAVGISNEYAIISAALEDIGNNTDAGAAYIYKRASDETWNLAQKLKGARAQFSDLFGFAAKISNEYAIIGARSARDAYAYIYERSSNGTWNLAQRLQGTQDNSWFGSSVGISNGYAIVGDPAQDDFDGSVYIYERASDGTWNLAQRLLCNRCERNQFGWAVGISNRYRYAVIGTPGPSLSGIGNAYIYKRDINGVWLFSQTLGVSGSVPVERNGWSVAIWNDYILTGTARGKVYFYDGTNGLCEYS